MDQPMGGYWCFNVIRRGEFALRELIRQGKSSPALELLEGLMLTLDYFYLTTSIEMEYAREEWTEQMGKPLIQIREGIREAGLDDEDLFG